VHFNEQVSIDRQRLNFGNFHDFSLLF